MKQFIPDEVLLTFKPRPRPVIVAIARDLPAYCKQRIHTEITKLMPGGRERKREREATKSLFESSVNAQTLCILH